MLWLLNVARLATSANLKTKMTDSVLTVSNRLLHSLKPPSYLNTHFTTLLGNHKLRAV